MLDKDDPKSKWVHLAVKLVAALIIFKLGMLVGEFKIIKAVVLDRGADHKMLFWGKGDDREAGARFFHKRVAPGEQDMMWQQRVPAPGAGNTQPGTVQIP